MKVNTSFVISKSDVPVMDMGNAYLQFMVSTVETGSEDMSVMRGTLPAGISVPLHSHRDVEVFYVLEGIMDVYQDEKDGALWKSLQAGDLAVVRSNVKHAWRNRSGQPCNCVIFTGGEVYAFLHELGRPLDSSKPYTPPSPEFMQRVMELAQRYHFWLASPEENAAIGL